MSGATDEHSDMMEPLLPKRNKQESMRTGAQPLDEQDGKETRNQEKDITGTRKEDRNEDRVKQEKEERERVKQLVEELNRHHGEYHLTHQMEDLGCRLQKYWYRGTSHLLPYEIIITVAPISKNCPLDLNRDLDIINERILPVLCEHKNLHKLHKIIRMSDIHVAVVQQLHPLGSLRDLLYKANYECDWSKKYSKKTMLLPQRTIALYGRQILEAMVFLYEQGFSPLGHIHSGNVFITDGGCALGGIDNSLLGYRSSVHKLLGEELLAPIDVIMFGLNHGNKVKLNAPNCSLMCVHFGALREVPGGRLIFEMASRRDLLHLIPDEEDLSTVRDTEVKAVLESIFQLDKEGMLTSSIQKILCLQLFKSVKYSPMKLVTTLNKDSKVIKILQASEPRIQAEMKPDEVLVKLDEIREKLKFSCECDLPHIGWCKSKHWKLVSRPDDSTYLLMSFAEVSKTCPIVLIDYAIRTLNNFLKSCSQHPFLHPIQEIQFYSDYVVTVQPLQKTSLKDLIYKTDPLSDWSEKQNSEGRSLPKEKVFLYSKQILKALQTLYEMGFPPLGQLHSGNIFVDGDTCQLGGYDNTLLGYRTQYHDVFSDHVEFIDVVMFGHVVYEMGSGKELLTLRPFEEDYKEVSNKDVKSFLKWVFQTENNSFVHSIEEICQHHLINKAKMSEDSSIPAIMISEDMKYLLSKVTKGKVRKNTKFGLFRGKVGRYYKGAKKGVKKGAKTVAKGFGVAFEKLTKRGGEKETSMGEEEEEELVPPD